jgi:hypothetical protein
MFLLALRATGPKNESRDTSVTELKVSRNPSHGVVPDRSFFDDLTTWR